MQNLPDRRVLIRWMFDALGFLLIFGHDFVIHKVLCPEFWGALIFGENTAGYFFLMAAAYFYLVPTALLCWITASGLKRNKRWTRPVGIVTCALLLCGFPWLMVLGFIGLHVLMGKGPQAAPAAAVPGKPTTDFWNAKRKSKAQPAVLTVLWMVGMWVPVWFQIYAKRAGMPAWNPGGLKWWLWFSLFILCHTALHESGHAIIAWAAGFKLQVISIGPFAFWRDHSGFQFRFDTGRLFESGGYMGAVPVSDRNLRANEIAVIAAGPATNALTCLVLLAVFFSLPGTAYQHLWWFASTNAVIAAILTIGNSIPLGYCDGTMLLHLVLWTPAGRLLLDGKRVTQLGQEADACHGRAEFYREVELKEAMLKRSLAFGKENAFMIAACHQALGSAYVLVEDWPAADFHYRKCLEFEAEIAANPTLAGNAWSGLHLTCTRRQQFAEAGRTYASAIAILEKQKAGDAGFGGAAITFAMLSQAHERNGAFDAAVDEIDQALRQLPRGDSGLALHAHLLRTKAVCRLHLGETDVGLADARSAAALFRSPKTPIGRRNLAWENVADLGNELWRAGEAPLAIELLREGIAHLESGGAAAVAAGYRIKLATILRHRGWPEEARAELPKEEGLTPVRRRAYLAERAQIHLITRRPDLAVADCRELVALWRAHPCVPAPEIAAAEALLAKACLAEGDPVEAESLARDAYGVLSAWGHSDAASCLISLALAQSQTDGECSSVRIAEAFQMIDADLRLSPIGKERLKEAENARVRQVHDAIAVMA